MNILSTQFTVLGNVQYTDIGNGKYTRHTPKTTYTLYVAHGSRGFCLTQDASRAITFDGVDYENIQSNMGPLGAWLKLERSHNGNVLEVNPAVHCLVELVA